MVSTDRKEWRRNVRNKSSANELLPLSPPEDSYLTGALFGGFSSSGRGRLRHSSEASCGSENDLDEGCPIIVGTVSRRTLFNLTSVLNLSYNDYDFSQTKSERFTLANITECVSTMDSKFSTVLPDFFEIKNDFWRIVDNEIKIDECVLYR